MVISKLSIPHRSQLSSLHMCLHPRVCVFIRYKLKIDFSSGRNSSCYKNIASTGTRSRCWTRRCWIGGRNDWYPNAQAGSWFSSSSPGHINMIIRIGRENRCNGESSWTRYTWYTWCILSVLYIYTCIMAKQMTQPQGVRYFYLPTYRHSWLQTLNGMSVTMFWQLVLMLLKCLAMNLNSFSSTLVFQIGQLSTLL